LTKKLGIARHEQTAAKVLVAAAAAMGILLLAKVVFVAVEQTMARSQVNSAFEMSGKNSNALETYKKHSQEEMSKVIAKNPFAGEAQKPSPPQFAGIMGDEALFNGQWYKVGAEVAGSKILKIDPTSVSVQFGDRQMVIVPEARPDPNARMAGAGPSRSGPGGDMRRGDFGGPGGPGGRSGRGGFGGFLNMSQQERDNMRQRFMNMSPDERRDYFRQMRENAGNRGQ